jgi:uncharacterized protein (TIGR02594 family)
MDNPREPKPGEPDGLGPFRAEVPAGMPWVEEGLRLLHDGGVELSDISQGWMLRIARSLDSISPLDVAWCGLFVHHCITTAFPGTRTPWLPMRARPWLRYGRVCAPQFGALMVFWLHGRHSPFGHSGFCLGEDDHAFHVLGGNQRNRLRIQRVGRGRLLGARWPVEAWPPPGIVRRADPEEAAPFEFGEDKEPAPAAATPMRSPS